MYLLGIDLGTTGCKSILFNFNGEIISETYIEYGLLTTSEGHIEQDADQWWSLTKAAVRETVRKSKVDPVKIKALSVSSQGIAFVPVDESGRALCNAVSWLDTRALEQTGFVRDLLGEKEVFERTGKRINPAYSLPKIIWLRENRPDIYKNTWKFLMGLDYITFKLTGKAVTDHSMASGTMAYNITGREWDRDILGLCGIDPDKFPEIRYICDIIGPVLPDTASELGLSGDTAVILGAQDQKCAAVGAGIREGLCTVSLGTATAITTVSGKPVIDSGMKIPCFALDRERWVLEAVLATSGVGLKWLKNMLLDGKSYKDIDDMVEAVSPGAEGLFFYPHFEGVSSPYWMPDERGFIYGLGLSTSKSAVFRSLYEGIAFQIRTNIDILEELGPDINEIRIFGGGAKSAVWCKIIADVTDRKVSTLYTPETANLGAAVIAGVGAGIYGGLDSVSEGVKLAGRTYKPDMNATRIYDKTYGRYMDIQKRMLTYSTGSV